MSEYQESSCKFRSSSSSENRDSVDSLNAASVGGDEEFYEKIEAPKFVDFTVPDHYCPDDRYWFCLRVGCDQKHEEEIDSEEIYKNFVLRVMAARSPNVRLRKALDRNGSRTPIKCPHSAPPKSSRPRLSRMAIMSSISKKMVDDKRRVVKPPLRSGCTPVTKTKPVAAKYLTTPRNKKSISEQNSFRSVQNPKPVNIEVEKGRMVAKALVFHSPKNAIKVKTSVELKTPISKLCQGMKKLEISSQKKHPLVSSSKSSKNLSNSSIRKQLSSRKVQRKPEVPRRSQACNNKVAKSGISVETTIKGQLSQQQASTKLVGSNETLANNEKQQLNVTEELFGLQESFLEESCMSSVVPLSTHDSDLALPDDLKKDNCSDVEECNNTRSQVTNTQENSSSLQPTSREENNSNDANEIINSPEGERNGHEFMDSDDKENASASDGNRIYDNNLKQNGRQILGLHEKFSQVQKKVTQQAQNKILKEGSSGPVMKLKKPKPTNPKPFRLRTDERGILKEATLEKRTDPQTPQSEGANLSTPGGKLQRKQRNDIQKGSTIIGLKTPKGQERSKAAALVTPESNKHQERKLIRSPLESNAMQRLEKFRKITSPLPKHTVRPQGLVSTKHEIISYLIPGQKLDVIHEASPEVVTEPREGKPTRNALTSDDAGPCAASRSSSRGRRPVTVAMEPNFHSTHVPRSCIKRNLSR